MEHKSRIFEIFRTDPPSKIYEIMENIEPGDFIYGLGYEQLLKFEEMLKKRLGDVHVLYTSTGYGFIKGSK